MTSKQSNKLSAIVRNYVNGNISDAKAGIKRLTRAEVAYLVSSHLSTIRPFTRVDRVIFEDFVIRTLES